MAEQSRSWWARAVLVGGFVALVLLPLGPIGTRLGVWNFQIGLLLIPAGTLLALIGLIGGVVGVFVSRRRGLAQDMSALYTGVGVCAIIVVAMFVQLQQGLSVPPIHNISTDVEDPPEFSAAVVELRGEGSNPLEYNATELGPQQREAYPEVQSLNLETPPGETVDAVVAALEAMGLEIVAVDAEGGMVEATDTTFWFGFKDDVVVRVRGATGGGSVVDVRSVSRVGLSDLGKNAARIMDLLARLEG